jgi:hypothetical protein
MVRRLNLHHDDIKERLVIFSLFLLIRCKYKGYEADLVDRPTPVQSNRLSLLFFHGLK